MDLKDIAKILPSLALVGVVGFGIWLELQFPHHKSIHMAVVGTSDAPSLKKSISENEKTEARDQARLLTLNAQTLANRGRDNKKNALVRFPSFEKVVRDQVDGGILSPSLAENLLAENASREAFLSLRVGYIYRSKTGVLFPVITNDAIDKGVNQMDDPASMTLSALGLSDSGSQQVGPDENGGIAVGGGLTVNRRLRDADEK